MFQVADAQLQCAHHVTSLWPNVHEGNFLPPQSKQITCARPALNLMHLSVTVAQQMYFVSPIFDKCTKTDHCSTATIVFS
jgi:hypothetical protein